MNLPISAENTIDALTALMSLKPVTTLVKKIADATGVIYEPTKIRRKAKAEAESKIIKAQADVEVKKIKTLGELELNEIQQRAMTRVIYQEERKQSNFEQIISSALPQISENAPTENIDEDWLAYFFAHCELVSDGDMQSLWSNILAGEASNPSRFSKRTIDCVAMMSKDDAELFTKCCQFVITLDEEPIPFFHPSSDEHGELGKVYTNADVKFNTLYDLESMSLIKLTNPFGMASSFNEDKKPVYYFGKEIKPNTTFSNVAIFTKIGKELMPICGAQENPEFYQYIVELKD